MLIGYMRVSTDNDRQTTDLQWDALLAAGVDARHVFEDKASGARDDRPGLQECLDYLEPGDTLVVWKLDRLGRSFERSISKLPGGLRIITFSAILVTLIGLPLLVYLSFRTLWNM